MNNIRRIGRHIIKNGLDYFSYSGSGFEFDAEPYYGKTSTIAINLISELKECDDQYLSIFINDLFYKRERLLSGEHIIELSVKKKSRIRVVKCNEAYLSSIYLKKLDVNDGVIVRPVYYNRKLIGFYGDSLTCGYGLLAHNDEGFKMSTEDFTKTYAYLASFALKMDYSVVARSGISIALPYYLDKSFNDIYDTVDLENKCDVNYQVDYAVINLGANDTHAYNESKDKTKALNTFYQEYIKLVESIIRTSPNAKFVLCHHMTNEYHPDFVKKLEDVSSYIKERYKLPVLILEFIPNSDGASFHPYISAHKENSKLLIEALKLLK